MLLGDKGLSPYKYDLWDIQRWLKDIHSYSSSSRGFETSFK